MEADRIKVQPVGHSILPTSTASPLSPVSSFLEGPALFPISPVSPVSTFVQAPSHMVTSDDMPPPILSDATQFDEVMGHEMTTTLQVERASKASKLSSVSNCSHISKASKSALRRMMQEEMAMDEEISVDGDDGEKSIGTFGPVMSGFARKSSQRRTFGRSKTLNNLTELLRGDDRIDVLLRDDPSEVEDHKQRRCHCDVFNPESLFVRVWHVLTSFVVIYISIMVLVGVGFSWYKIPYAAYIFNYFIDGYCWLDMAVTFNTGYVHGGHLIMDRKKIAKHYLAFWFWIDLMANVPWESIITVDKSNRKAVKFVKWLKLPRLLRIARLRKLLRANGRYLNVVLTLWSTALCIHMGACFWVFIVDPCSAYFDEEPFSMWTFRHEVQDDLVARHPSLGWECLQSNIFQVYCQALMVSAASLLGVDGASFGGYVPGGGASSSLLQEVISKAKLLGDPMESAAQDASAARTRALKLVLLRGRYPLSMSEQLFASSILAQNGTHWLNWDGLNTQANMNMFAMTYAIPMDIFGTFMLLLGLYLQGSLFANLTKINVCKQLAERNYRRAHDAVKRELDQYGPMIPEEVQERIEKHFQFRWVNQAYGPLQLLNPELLSLSLRSELALCLYGASIKKVEFLKGAPVAILTRICLNLELQYFMVHDIIYRRGEPPTGFYVVDKGKVVITSRSLTRATAASYVSQGDAKEVTAGDHFGVGAVLAAIQDQSYRATGWAAGFHSIACTSIAVGGFDVLNKKSAYAVTVCQLLWLPLDAFQEICNDHPKFFQELTHPSKIKALEDEGRSREFRPTDLRSNTIKLRGSTESTQIEDEDTQDNTVHDVHDECNGNQGSRDTGTTFSSLPGAVPQVSNETVGAGERKKKPGVQIRTTVESLAPASLDADTKARVQIRSTVESVVVGAHAESAPHFRSTVESEDAMESASSQQSRKSLQGRCLPPLPGSGRPSLAFAGPIASSEVQEEVTKLEQSVQSEGEKIDKALRLIQELLKSVPDRGGSFSNGKAYENEHEVAVSLL